MTKVSTMQIIVKDMLNKNICLDVDRFETVENLKLMIEDSEGVPVESQRLIFSGKQLQDGHTLADYNIQKVLKNPKASTAIYTLRLLRFSFRGVCLCSVAMETSRGKVIMLCHWDGCIKYGPDGVYYEGPTSEYFRVKQKTELNRLLEGLYKRFGLDKERSKFEIWGKFPVLVQQSKLKYLLLPVVDDSSFAAMLDVPSNHPSITNVELFLEVKTTSDDVLDPNSCANPLKRQRTNPNPSSEGCLNKALTFPSGVVSKPCVSSSLWLGDDMRLGLCFKDVDELKKAVDWYCIRGRRKSVARETEKKDVYRFECVRTKCNWSLHAARVEEGLVEVTKYNATHTCSLAENVKSDFVADEIESVVRLNPTLSIQELKKWWKEKLGYELQASHMLEGKFEVIRRVYGDEEQSLRAVPKLISALQSSNEMLVDWRYEVFPNPKYASFSGLFWTFSQCIKGFQHCRPLVVVDTRDLYGGNDYVSPRCSQFKLMIASGLDAANRYFPLAFAVTREVSVETWRWFLSRIREKVTQREGLCLVSSPDEDIVTVVNEPGSQWKEHRFCLKGLCSQFCDVVEDGGEELVRLVKKAGYSSQKRDFDSYMDEIKEKRTVARKWLNKIHPHQWALAHDNGGLRYGLMEIDTKALYAVFRDFLYHRVALSGVLVLMFDDLREAFDESFTCSSESLNRGDVYTKPIMDKLEEFVRDYDAAAYVITPLEGDAFVVSGNEKWIVKLNESICTCGKFQGDKFPCVHALALCEKLRINPLKYVDDCYLLERYHKTYSAEFSPVPEVSAWPEASGVPMLLPPLLPPKVEGKI
ncbi:unnamed protein product [Microthlaspi erraticum]|uniref:SWIM-type domain-containing protein n=1 Tax=Microthlaspi erraticum TaxID=1685480 RepID=A0A6D2KYI2_9BRAS|nr:unnamed protein product [Microthlaspi erraticum]